MSERATGQLESRRRQELMGSVSGEGNRRRLLELKANRLRQTGGVDCERSSEERFDDGVEGGRLQVEGEGGIRARSELEREDKQRARSASVSTPPHTKPLAARTSSFSPGSLAVGPAYLAGREKTRLSNFSFRL